MYNNNQGLINTFVLCKLLTFKLKEILAINF